MVSRAWRITTRSMRSTIYGIEYHNAHGLEWLMAAPGFFNPYRHGFVRLAVATPLVRVGDPEYNLVATLALMQEAAKSKVSLAVFPELGLSAYSCEDLFHQQALLEAAEDALAKLLARTRNLRLAALVGLPVAREGRLYNCAALICQGRLIGVVPKTYLPNYPEFYE